MESPRHLVQLKGCLFEDLDDLRQEENDRKEWGAHFVAHSSCEALSHLVGLLLLLPLYFKKFLFNLLSTLIDVNCNCRFAKVHLLFHTDSEELIL